MLAALRTLASMSGKSYIPFCLVSKKGVLTAPPPHRLHSTDVALTGILLACANLGHSRVGYVLMHESCSCWLSVTPVDARRYYSNSVETKGGVRKRWQIPALDRQHPL